MMIVNNHALDVAVLNVAQGHRDRLGQVTAMAGSSFNCIYAISRPTKFSSAPTRSVHRDR